MIIRHFIIVIVYSTSIFVSFTPSYAEVPHEIASIEQKVIKNRVALKSWHVRAYVTRTLFQDKELEQLLPGGEVMRPLYTDFYYDGKNMREDLVFEYDDKTTSQSQKGIHYSSFDDQFHYLYTSGVEKDGAKFALQATRRETALEMYKDGKLPLIDMRIFGLYPTGLNLRDFELTSLIENPERTNFIMSDDVIDDISCKKISFIDERDYPVTIWIAPELGYNMIRCETWSDKNGFRNTVSLKIEKHKESGIWFPVSYVADEFENGKPYSHSDIRIEVISFNKSFPTEIFTPKGMGVPVGTRVYINPSPVEVDNFFWDGNMIRGEFGTVFVTNVDSFGKRYFNLRLLMIASGLALVCAACYFKYVTYRKEKN